MIFKRGIASGIILIIGSLPLLYEQVSILYGIALLFGIIQIVVSINYQNGYKKKILLFCFGIEGLYYIFAIVYMFMHDITFIEMFFCLITFLGVGVLIGTSVYKLYSQI